MLYLLHATQPLQRSNGVAVRHYLGYSPSPSTLRRRVARHRNGRGAHLTLALAQLPDQVWYAVNVWEGGRLEERLLKNRHHLATLCPLCNPHMPMGTVATPLPRPRRLRFRKPSRTPGWGNGGAW